MSRNADRAAERPPAGGAELRALERELAALYDAYGRARTGAENERIYRRIRALEARIATAEAG